MDKKSLITLKELKEKTAPNGNSYEALLRAVALKVKEKLVGLEETDNTVLETVDANVAKLYEAYGQYASCNVLGRRPSEETLENSVEGNGYTLSLEVNPQAGKPGRAPLILWVSRKAKPAPTKPAIDRFLRYMQNQYDGAMTEEMSKAIFEAVPPGTEIIPVRVFKNVNVMLNSMGEASDKELPPILYEDTEEGLLVGYVDGSDVWVVLPTCSTPHKSVFFVNPKTKNSQ